MNNMNKRATIIIAVILVLLALGILFYYIQPSSQQTQKKGDNSLETIESNLQGLEQDFDAFDQGVESDFKEFDNLLGQLEG